jgi:hypothetical protein
MSGGTEENYENPKTPEEVLRPRIDSDRLNMNVWDRDIKSADVKISIRPENMYRKNVDQTLGINPLTTK